MCRLLPEHGMTPRPGTGLKGETGTGHAERQLPLAAAHAVGADGEFGRGQPKTSIDQIAAIFLQDDNIVLLSKIADDFIDRSGFGYLFVPIHGLIFDVATGGLTEVA